MHICIYMKEKNRKKKGDDKIVTWKKGVQMTSGKRQGHFFSKDARPRYAVYKYTGKFDHRIEKKSSPFWEEMIKEIKKEWKKGGAFTSALHLQLLQGISLPSQSPAHPSRSQQPSADRPRRHPPRSQEHPCIAQRHAGT